MTSAPEATAASLLPPKQRLKLFQPRSKLEQFEDILLESQLLEASLAGGSSTSFSDIVTAADNLMSSNPHALTMPGLPLGPGGYPGMSLDTIDFDTSDDIFGEMIPGESSTRIRKNSTKVAEHPNSKNKVDLFPTQENGALTNTKGMHLQI